VTREELNTFRHITSKARFISTSISPTKLFWVFQPPRRCPCILQTYGVNKNFAARKKLEATRAFFRFCNVSDWIGTNPASALKPGKTTDPQIVPITKPEFSQIINTCDIYPDKQNAIRLRAIILMMRYTGLRIRDVVTLRKDHIRDGRVFLRTAKSGTDVFCPVPLTVTEALGLIGAKGEHFFWTGASKPKTAVTNYQRALRKLFVLAGLPHTPRASL